ncbi:tyrosine-type recombinase/integrase [Streptomyces sp. NPDC049099]|uniref:tyrosine-type recombinase/integrase n=1 Tax=Streptomyces sp. NPDC049099 TaxID=3155768 RepID=UPI003436E816
MAAWRTWRIPQGGSGKQQGSDASRGAIPDEHHPCFAAQRVLYRPEEAAAALGIGRSLVYEETRLGRLQTVRIGKRRRPKVYGDTKTEVRQKMRDLRKEVQSGVKAPANCTVADAVNDWLERGLKGRDEKGTLGKNRSMANKHLIPFTGKAKLEDLGADDVDDWLDGRAEFLATRTLRDLLAILRRSIEQAQRRDKAARNVALLVTAPEGRPGRPSKALNLKQAEPVLAAARPSRLYAYLVLSLLSGVRTEEARPEWSPAGRFFTTRPGEPLDAANVRRDFKAIVKKAGPAPERTPRELRHGFVSLLSDHGIPLERIAQLVGHTSQATTEAVYRKQLRPVIIEGAEAMDVGLWRLLYFTAVQQMYGQRSLRSASGLVSHGGCRRQRVNSSGFLRTKSATPSADRPVTSAMPSAWRS